MRQSTRWADLPFVLLWIVGCSDDTPQTSHDAAGADQQVVDQQAADQQAADTGAKTGDAVVKADLPDAQAVADTAGKPCDPLKYKAHCKGTVAYRCVQKKIISGDCAGSPNPLCAAGECAASKETSKCAYGTLPGCKSLKGFNHALQCSNFKGVYRTFYATCTDKLGKPTGCKTVPVPGGGNRGECLTGKPCTGSYRKCSGNTLQICSGGGLTSTDCAKSGKVCLVSSLGNGWAACHQKGEKPCKPATFKDHCTSTTKGVLCSFKIGYTYTFDCATSGKKCCYAFDAGVSNFCC